MNDRSDELSTADLAGQSAGSGARPTSAPCAASRPPGRANGTTASRAIARRTPTTPTTAAYDDRVDGMGSGGFPGGTPADRTAYADDDPTMTTDGADRRRVRRRAARRRGRRWPDGRRRPVRRPRRGSDGADRGHQAAPTGTMAGAGAAGTGPLLDTADTEGFRARWTDVQTGFVDAPRRSVEQADAPGRRADAAPGEVVRRRAQPAGEPVGPR